MPLTRLFSSRISLATAWWISFAPLLVASFKVMVGSYLAWIGQIGMQLVLPAQARRFRYGWELRAAGRLRTLSRSRASHSEKFGVFFGQLRKRRANELIE